MAKNKEQVIVVLGGAKHSIKLLPLRDSRIWRAKMISGFETLLAHKADWGDFHCVEEMLNVLFIKIPDFVVDLVFEYAKDLDRDEIESVATNAEMAKAFDQICELEASSARGLIGKIMKWAHNQVHKLGGNKNGN